MRELWNSRLKISAQKRQWKPSKTLASLLLQLVNWSKCQALSRLKFYRHTTQTLKLALTPWSLSCRWCLHESIRWILLKFASWNRLLIHWVEPYLIRMTGRRSRHSWHRTTVNRFRFSPSALFSFLVASQKNDRKNKQGYTQSQSQSQHWCKCVAVRLCRWWWRRQWFRRLYIGWYSRHCWWCECSGFGGGHVFWRRRKKRNEKQRAKWQLFHDQTSSLLCKTKRWPDAERH